MNIVMNDMAHYVEIQGTAEGHAFSASELATMLELAETGIKKLLEIPNISLLENNKAGPLKKIVLVSSNPGKIKEFSEFFLDLNSM